MKIKVYESIQKEYGELIACENGDNIRCVYSNGAKPSTETTETLNNIIEEYYFKLKLSLDTEKPSKVNINDIYKRRDDGLKVVVKDIMLDLTTFKNTIILDGLRVSLDNQIKIIEDDFLEKYEKCNIKKHVVIITGNESSALMEGAISQLTNYGITILQDSYLFTFTKNGVKDRLEDMFSISPKYIDDFMTELTNMISKYSDDDLSKYLNNSITRFYNKNNDDNLLMIYGGDNQAAANNVLKDIDPKDITWINIFTDLSNTPLLTEYFYKNESLLKNELSDHSIYRVNDYITFNRIMTIRISEFLDLLFNKIIS